MNTASETAHSEFEHASRNEPDRDARYFLIGAGIASLAAAAFLCRDGAVDGKQIVVIEALDDVGGSLDAEGSAQYGYVMRGTRTLEYRYVCTYDLFSCIPTLQGDRSVTGEIFDWNNSRRSANNVRLLRDGHRLSASEFQLTESDIASLRRMITDPEASLNDIAIDNVFDKSFFHTNAWLMWSATFGFRSWHSAAEFRRHLSCFAHMIPSSDQLRGTLHSVFNQYHSLVRPLAKWLSDQGVTFSLNTRVTDLEFTARDDDIRVHSIRFMRGTSEGQYALDDNDKVIITLGSMTEGASQGAMDRPARYSGKPSAGAWNFWETIARGRPAFGRPEVFSAYVEKSQWLSFTLTLRRSEFSRLIRNYTDNDPGEGGVVTFARSSWLISLTLPHQPHFPGQPDDIEVFWGHGISIELPGDFVRKPMHQCTGREIMIELLGHLGMPAESRRILEGAVCIPCYMPYATAQFLRRKKGDRPEVAPPGYSNIALIGQFCELPDDIVFTIEYSVRSAQTAVYRLLGLDKLPPPVCMDPQGAGSIDGLLRACMQH
jgi:oleate hydratase